MKIERVSVEEYAKAFPSNAHAFNSAAFAELNVPKCEAIHYLLFSDTKIRLGIIMGERDNCLHSPFSAPFGGFDYKTEPKIEYIEQALSLIKSYAWLRSARMTIPPAIYDASFNAKIVNCLSRIEEATATIDLNYHYDLSRFPDFEKHLSRAARKNFHNAMEQGFGFEVLDSGKDSDVARTYEVIRQNRVSHGYPLRMTLQNVLDTVKIIDADFMVVTKDGADIAAAQVFHVANGIAQVVYWGDAPGHAAMRPMNYLVYKVFEHYYNKGLWLLDIGPSTECGKPNYGLCEFKENLGCEISLKHTFLIR